MSSEDPYGLETYAKPVSRTLADAMKADRAHYHDPIHGVGASADAPKTSETSGGKSRFLPIDVAGLTDLYPRREPDGCGVDVAALSEPCGPSKLQFATPAADRVPIRGDGMDRYVPKPPTFLRDESSGGKVLETVRAISDHPGAAPMWAAWRNGLVDLQNFFAMAFPDSRPGHDSPGSIGHPAPDAWTGQDRHAGPDVDR